VSGKIKGVPVDVLVRREGRRERRYRIGRGRKTIERTAIGAGAGVILGGIFGSGKGSGIGSVLGGAGGLATADFHRHRKITLNSSLEMIHFIGP
jgi:hypothetical protein